LPQEEFEVGEYATFQIKVRTLEERTKLNFHNLHNFDPLEDESKEHMFVDGTAVVSLESLSDIVL
jgi:DNA/RNA endonuclease G (NUC1)